MPAMAEMQPAVIVWDFNSAPVPTRLISRFVKKVREMANQNGGRVFERAFMTFGDACLMGMSASRTISDIRGVDLMHVGQAGQCSVNEKIREKLTQFDIDYRKQPGIIALITGDQSFVDLLSTMSRGGWRVQFVHPTPIAKRDLLDWVDHHCTVEQLLLMQGDDVANEKQKKRLSDVTNFLLVSGMNAEAVLTCELVLTRLHVMIEEVEGAVHYYNSSTDEALISFRPLRKEAKNGTASAIVRRCRAVFGGDVAAIAVRDPRAELQRMRFIVDEHKHHQQRLNDDAETPQTAAIPYSGAWHPSYGVTHFYQHEMCGSGAAGVTAVGGDDPRFSSTSGVSSLSSQAHHHQFMPSGLFLPSGMSSYSSMPPPMPVFHHMPAPIFHPVNQQHLLHERSPVENGTPHLVSAGEVSLKTDSLTNRSPVDITAKAGGIIDRDSARHSSIDSGDEAQAVQSTLSAHNANSPSKTTTASPKATEAEEDYCASEGDDDELPERAVHQCTSQSRHDYLSTIPENSDEQTRKDTVKDGIMSSEVSKRISKSPPPGFAIDGNKSQETERKLSESKDVPEFQGKSDDSQSFDFARVLKISSQKSNDNEFPPLPQPKPSVARYSAVTAQRRIDATGSGASRTDGQQQQHFRDPHRQLILRPRTLPQANPSGANSSAGASSSSSTRTVARTQSTRYNNSLTPSFTKPAQQCVHWDDPKHPRHNCTFWHPRELCRYYPRCFYTAEQCGFAHPFCASFCGCPEGKRDSQQNHRNAPGNHSGDRRKSFPDPLDSNNNERKSPKFLFNYRNYCLDLS